MVARNRPMVRRVESTRFAVPFGDVDMAIARDYRTVRQSHDQGRVVLAAVRVDEEARKGREHSGCAEPSREAARHVGRTDVVGDVALEFGGVEPEPPVLRRDLVARMIAEEDEARTDVAINLDEGRVLVRRRTLTFCPFVGMSIAANDSDGALAMP